jgi:hypothetical protein
LEVLGDVGSAARTTFLPVLDKHRDRGLRAQAVYVAKVVNVDHGVADDKDVGLLPAANDVEKVLHLATFW